VSTAGGVTSGVGVGVAAAEDAAVDGAELGLGDADAPQAAARMATRPTNRTDLLGPERIWCIAGLLLCVDWPIRFPLVLGTCVGVDDRRRLPVAGRLRAGASRHSRPA